MTPVLSGVSGSCTKKLEICHLVGLLSAQKPANICLPLRSRVYRSFSILFGMKNCTLERRKYHV